MNKEDPQTLFRPQALESRRHRLEGDVIVLTGRWLHRGTIILFSLLVVALVLLSISSFPRIQQVPGWLTTTRGMIQILPIRAGVVIDVPVKEGQHVNSGDIVASVRVEQIQQDMGGTPQAVILASLQKQDKTMLDQINLARQQADNEINRLVNDIMAEQSQVTSLDVQIGQQQLVTNLAKADFERSETLLKVGGLARRDADNRQAQWAGSSRELALLKQNKAALLGQIAEARNDIDQRKIQRDTKIANLETERAQLNQKETETQGEQSYAFSAPVSGRIASLVARPGDPADGRHPLMLIIPDGANLEAELFVPSSAVGFIRQGEGVRLLYDAFPHAYFGSQSGTVTHVSSSAFLPADIDAPLQIKEPVYLVRVALEKSNIRAFGSNAGLQPGMTLTANVILESRNLIEWLFEPIYALRGRS